MKPILLIILSLFVCQSYAADDDYGADDGPYRVFMYDNNTSDVKKVEVWSGRSYTDAIIVQETDTIRTVIDKFYDSRNSCNRIKLQPINVIYLYGKKMLSADLAMDQTVASCDLLRSTKYHWTYIDVSQTTIKIKCATLTGKSFEIDWPVFTSIEKLSDKIIKSKLLKVEPGWRLKFIHNRAGRLDDDICADQVAGLLEDPNLTVVIEPIGR